MKKALFYVFLVIFGLTAMVTLGGITKVIAIDDFYLKGLFGALLVQLVGAVIALYRRADFFEHDVISYTDTLTLPEPPDEDRSEQEQFESPLLPAISLLTIPDLTSETAEAALVSLRERGHLRSLSLVESGLAMERMPAGSYFFVGATYLHDNPSQRISIIPAERRGSRLLYFECHRRSDLEFALVGFCAGSAAISIANLDGVTAHELMLSASLWDHATTLVLLPFSRIADSSVRAIEQDDGYDLQVLDLSVI